jgi:hypothetical protein
MDYESVNLCDAVAELCSSKPVYGHDKVVIDLLQMGFIRAMRNPETGELGYLPTDEGMKLVRDKEMLYRIFHDQ